MSAATWQPPRLTIRLVNLDGADHLGQFVLYLLTRSEPLPEEEREAALALGQRRFDHFIGQVAQKWARNNGFAARIQKPHRG